MHSMYDEIWEIPDRAQEFISLSVPFSLPVAVPYLGMGSSYFASVAFRYMGIEIQPELASEFYYYLSHGKRFPYGVILSQSGKSTEPVWCTQLFKQYTAITNDQNSPLATLPGVNEVIPILAGEERFSSSKTYINTLLALFKGFQVDPLPALSLLSKRMQQYDTKGKGLSSAVFEVLQQKNINGIYITGNGPNLATALQAALILSESTKLSFQGLSMAQYDHGPKETANNSIVFMINAKGPSYQRSQLLYKTIRTAGAHVFEIEEPDSPEAFSILHNIIPLNFMAYYLAKELGVKDTFVVGDKITEVSEKNV